MLLRRGNWPITTTRYGGGVKLHQDISAQGFFLSSDRSIQVTPSHLQDNFCLERGNLFLGGAAIEISIYSLAIAP